MYSVAEKVIIIIIIHHGHVITECYNNRQLICVYCSRFYTSSTSSCAVRLVPSSMVAKRSSPALSGCSEVSVAKWEDDCLPVEIPLKIWCKQSDITNKLLLPSSSAVYVSEIWLPSGSV